MTKLSINGREVEVADGPMASLYGLGPRTLDAPKPDTSEVVKLGQPKSRKRRRK